MLKVFKLMHMFNADVLTDQGLIVSLILTYQLLPTRCVL